jgi:hypothetical protein
VFFFGFTSLSFLHRRPRSKHSVDLHLMLRALFPHFDASLRKPAQIFVVLNFGVSSTFTYRFAAAETFSRVLIALPSQLAQRVLTYTSPLASNTASGRRPADDTARYSVFKGQGAWVAAVP